MKSIFSVACLSLVLSTNAVAAAAIKPTPLLERYVTCNIIHASTVNCRSGPSLSDKVLAPINGNGWEFTCYKVGDCYENNWYVPYLEYEGQSRNRNLTYTVLGIICPAATAT